LEATYVYNNRSHNDTIMPVH